MNYEKIKINIEEFLERRKKPFIIMAYLILSDNKSEMGEWYNYWIDKVDDLQIWYPHNYTGGKKEYDNVLNYSKQVKSCGRPGKDFIIRANGDVCTCCFDFNHNLVVGNLYKERFNDIVKGQKELMIENMHKNNIYNGIVCEHCDQILNREKALYYSKNSNFKVGEKSQ